MQNRKRTLTTTLLISAGTLTLTLTFATGCEEQKPAPEAKPAETASVAPAAPAPAPTPTATQADPSQRPEKIETTLTDDRRAALETKYASAKGFLVAKDLEDKLKGDKKIKDKKAAVAAFDKAAKGKWVLFSGPLVNLTDTGFDLGVVYTSQMENDPLGMSRQFFEVTMSEIEGYEKDRFKAGNVVVVLAKYNGGGKAGPGHEAVASGAWK
jgi:hypothetical protein